MPTTDRVRTTRTGTDYSAGGRQGMVFSQRFPRYFDGIIAGDPIYDLQMVTLTVI